MLCILLSRANTMQKARNASQLQKDATQDFQPDAEPSALEQVQSFIQDLSKLSLKEQSSENEVCGSQHRNTLIEKLFKSPAGKGSASGMCTGSLPSSDSFQYHRTAKVSNMTSTYLHHVIIIICYVVTARGVYVTTVPITACGTREAHAITNLLYEVMHCILCIIVRCLGDRYTYIPW